MLRSPLHPVVSGAFALIAFRGRQSGRWFTTPVNYARAADGTVPRPAPDVIRDGLAVYRFGAGEPLLFVEVPDAFWAAVSEFLTAGDRDAHEERPVGAAEGS